MWPPAKPTTLPELVATNTLVELGPAVRIFSHSEALSSTFISDR
jgi:hypothetical protein